MYTINSQDSATVRAAFAVIKRYDPATYDRMRSESWYISSDRAELLRVTDDADIRDSLATSFDTAFAITLSDINPALDLARPYVALNARALAEGARDVGTDLVTYLAYILVHEFVHLHARTADPVIEEPPAYRAGSEFALKLPNRLVGRRIYTVSQDTLRHVYRRAINSGIGYRSAADPIYGDLAS